jgi:hypothetical protein
VGAICALLALGAWTAPAAALEFWDGRLAIHGFYAMQVRSIADDFSYSNGWDLTQWYHILNIEVEADIAPEGWGPFGMISAFGRIEIRYDCVWTRACGIFSSADTYGDRARRLPKRLLDGRRAGYTLMEYTGDTRRYREYSSFEFLSGEYKNIPAPSRRPLQFGMIPAIEGLSQSAGPDTILGTSDDPFPYYTFEYMNPKRCKFGVQNTTGSAELVGTRVLPHTPACESQPIAPLANRPNPLRPGDFNPITGTGGGNALPLRPAPKLTYGPRIGRGEKAQGVWYPNHELAEVLAEGGFDSADQNFTQKELEWNHGAAQQDEKELKELYFDIELFDSRLWLRLGKQTIVWGKTEIFRSTDQFNPQDLAIASLPSLEESRIALWAARGVWSFYNVGPLEDVRLEVAMNFDEFEPTDIGRCGEPYAPLPVCDKTYGLMIHGVIGLAIAGEKRPSDPWESWQGVEVGGRLEWRYDRFSFALTDFYGYADGGYVDPLFSYSRNVDPITGRPRIGMSTGPCRTGREAACLTEKNALTHHSVAQQYFNIICATTIGFSELDRSACGQTIFNSQALAAPELAPLSPTVTVAFGEVLSGQDPNALFGVTGGALFISLTELTPGAQSQIMAATRGNTLPNLYPDGVVTPLVPLVADPSDGLPADHPDPFQTPFVRYGLSPVLTNEQEALLGCGPFYGTNCDIHGLDLMNMETSAALQSWPIFDGTFGPGIWETTDKGRRQPGTLGFQGGPVCTRFEGGKYFILPGCRGPGDTGYNVHKDGSTFGDDLVLAIPGNYQRLHPFTGQQWKSEMAIFSWNLLMALVALSAAEDPNNPKQGEFDPSRPFRNNGCSFAQPVWCGNVAAYQAISAVQRNTVEAGGNGRFGRRDFIWSSGGDLVLRYYKRNVLGFSMDFAEDVTKSNWSFEFTWIEGVKFGDADSPTTTTEADAYNLSVSVDRPTFINFLNTNRTFFFNTQWFFQYVNGYKASFFSSGPWNVLTTISVGTGYFQDRLLAGATFVYDFQSISGAILPSVTYRFTPNLSATVGLAGFFGRYEERQPSLWNTAIGNRVGRGAYKSFVENGLSAIRERDELYLTIRYTF